jgi:integrase
MCPLKGLMPIYTDKRNGHLYVQFQYRGNTFKQSLPEGSSRADAKKLETKMRSDAFFQANGMAPKDETLFEDFVQEVYLPHVQQNTPASYHKAEYVCIAAKPFFKGKFLRFIKPGDIEKFKHYRTIAPTMHDKERAPATVWRELSILSRLFSLAIREGACDINPVSRIEKKSFDNVQDKILRREDEGKLFSNMHSLWARDICLMALYTGLRQNDIMRLTRFDVKLNDNCIRLTQGKTQRRMEVRLNSVSRSVIEARWHNKGSLLFPSPVTHTENGSVRHAIQRACARAGIPILTIRDLRRTFATRVIENGADAVTAAAMLGHSSLRMIPRYVRSIELQQKAADLLTRPATIPPEGQTEKVQVLKRKG